MVELPGEGTLGNAWWGSEPLKKTGAVGGDHNQKKNNGGEEEFKNITCL